MAIGLTAQQIAFAEAIVDGKTASEAYRLAGYNCDGASDALIASRGAKVLAGKAVSAYIEELRAEAANLKLWTREQVLSELQGLYGDAKDAITVKDENGETMPGVYNHQAAGVALKCLDTVSRMCGFDAPQQVQNTVTVQFSEDIAKYGK